MFRFWTCARGNMAVIFALTLPAIVGGAALAVDIGRLVEERSNLQAVADAAALAAANELYLANTDEQQVLSVAESFARANAADETGTLIVAASIKRDGKSSPVGNAVDVTLSKSVHVTIAHYVAPSLVDISVYSRARVSGGTRICVIGLADDNNSTILLDDSATMTAPTCSVYSNSTKEKGLSAVKSSYLRSEMTCSAGGVDGGLSNFRPAALTDCPQIEDPLERRAEPSVGPCSDTKLIIKDQSRTLMPGVYCGGLKITGSASVTAKPGVYVIKGGNLIVDKTASLSGQNVGFFFAGKNSTFTFSKEAAVDLTAPKSGEMAGLLFFQTRSANSNQTFRITSNYARNLIGTIYLPTGVLVVDADMAVADKSAYTAIVVKRLELKSTPNLVLNTNYNLTDVPVPDGVGEVKGGVFLER